MFADEPRTFDEVCEEAAWPLSRLYHQHSKLSEHKQQAFQEAIAAYSEDPEAIRQSSRAFKPYPTRPAVELPPVPHAEPEGTPPLSSDAPRPSPYPATAHVSAYSPEPL